jgi:uncharacterized membrane protein
MMPRKHIILMGMILIAEFVLTLVVYSRLPDRVPVHYGLSGEPDAYGSKLQLALLAPIVSVVLAGFLAVLPVLGPFRENFERFRVTYGRISVTVLGAIATIHAILLLKALGADFNVGSAACILGGAVVAMLGNWMGKVRRNFYVGIRTPWTLANDDVWRRTHRIGGKVMVAAGVIAAATGALAPPRVAFVVLIAVLLVAAGWSVVYSYVIYRKLGGVDDLASRSAARKT